jgi:hypothetical protein
VARVRLVFNLRSKGTQCDHDSVTAANLGRWAAQLIQGKFCGDYEPDSSAPECYFIGKETLLIEDALALGIQDEENFLGGAVHAPVIATKAISHPLVDTTSMAPRGWNPEFTNRTAGVVLPGFSAFQVEDAVKAGLALLPGGGVRLKPVIESGGQGQIVVKTADELESALVKLQEHASPERGLVLERNLTEVRTYSVGQVRLLNQIISYVGIQSETTNNLGRTAYGGSTLRCFQGALRDLSGQSLSDDEQSAVGLACIYDAAADSCLPGFLASRRNYDVAVGFDDRGEKLRGVLEQSWRIGGATGAELAAIERFGIDPTLREVRASAVERYGLQSAPEGCRILYHGADPVHGPLLKYVMVH